MNEDLQFSVFFEHNKCGVFEVVSRHSDIVEVQLRVERTLRHSERLHKNATTNNVVEGRVLDNKRASGLLFHVNEIGEFGEVEVFEDSA